MAFGTPWNSLPMPTRKIHLYAVPWKASEIYRVSSRLPQLNDYFLIAPEWNLATITATFSSCRPDALRKVYHILERNYLSVKTWKRNPDQWQKAVKQINEYAAAPRVRQLVQNTKLHCIIIQFRGWELERMEEV